MRLTIAICTYNRPSDLHAALGAIGDLGYHRIHEVVVVDNSDVPANRSENERAVGAWPGVRYSTSEPPGLSRARNVALAEATGDVIAYLDDDASCVAGWAEAILSGFEDRAVVCVGGPIEPEWEVPPPPWLGGELLQSLAIMDLGAVARDLEASESFYGANVAFRVPALRSVGGFAENLGRTRSDLMGDEEVEVQRRLRAHGRSRYVPGARVRHLVHRERCTLQWFLKRYAWQGVSDARTADPGTLDYLGTLLDPQRVPGAGELVAQLVGSTPRSTAEAIERMQYVRGLVGALLNDRVPARRTDAPTARRSLEAPEFEVFKSQVPGHADVLFLELGVAHTFLFGAYGQIRGATLLNPKLDPGRQPRESSEFIRNAVYFASRAGMRAVVLLTADVLTWPGYESALAERDAEIPVLGFLHRAPDQPGAIERLARVASRVSTLFVFSERMRRYLEAQLGLANVLDVPLPPLFLANAPAREPRATPPPDAGAPRRLALGLLGEVRPGKGFDFAVDALAAAPPAVRDRIEVVMAGAVDEAAERHIRSTCANAGIVAELDLRARSERDYRAIPDNVFARALARSDVVVYPYEGDHASAFSGHFGDALRGGSWFLASRGTAIGALVERHDLGETFEMGNRQSFLSALDTLMRRMESGPAPGPERARLVTLYSAGNACRVVEEALLAATARLVAASPRPADREATPAAP